MTAPHAAQVPQDTGMPVESAHGPAPVQPAATPPPASVAAGAAIPETRTLARPPATVLTGRLATAADTKPAAATPAAAAVAAVVPPWLDTIADPARVPPDRPSGWLPGGVHRLRTMLLLAQLALWQVALALAVTSLDRPVPIMVVMLGSAAALTAATAVRYRDQWLYRWLFALIRYACRRHRHRVPADVAPAAALLALVAPGALIADEIVTHAGGAAASFTPVSPTPQPMFGTLSTPLPDAADLLPPHDPQGPQITVQLVLRAVPPPGTGRAGASYTQLTGNRVSMRQDSWVVVGVRRDLTHLSDETLHTALLNTTRRLLRRRRLEGRPLHPVPVTAVVSTIGAIAAHPPRGVYTPAPPRQVDLFREGWQSWWAGAGEHALLHLRSPAKPDTMIADLIATPAAAVTISLAARRIGQTVETELVVDLLAADRTRLHAATQAAIATARRHGGVLSPLDGYQRRALGNVLPLGGFLPW